MAVTRETGVLLVADLTGYTAYLAGSEIEHAPTIAGDLLETVVGRLEPPFRLAKLEGDAAFLFVEDGRADPMLQLDAIEACYLAFRRRLRSIDAATSCDCSACNLAPKLDLKFFAHHGAFVRTRIAGRDEIAGPDVILVHRLLKGTTAAATFPSGFVLVTDAAATALGIDPAGLGMVRSVETVEHLGDVVTWAADLDARWQAETALRRLDPRDEPVLLDVELRVAAAPADAWAALTSPALRAVWEGAIEIDDGGGARRRAGLAWRRRHDTLRDGPPGDDRGSRRLAAVRARRLAGVRCRPRPGRGDRGPRGHRGCRNPRPAPVVGARGGGRRIARRGVHGGEACRAGAPGARAQRSSARRRRLAVRIGQLATRVGVSTDTVRFYERSGWLPRPARRDNDYREYGEADAEHLRLLIDLRRLDVPLDDAARIAAWCHSGHCAETDAALPALIAGRRTAIGERIEGLRALDARLAELERHLGRGRRSLAVVGSSAAGACCDAAGAIADSAERAAGGCACCATDGPGSGTG